MGQQWRAFDKPWSDLQLDFLREFPTCAARSAQCRGYRNVHHVSPVHLFPRMRLSRGNLVTLCKWHHKTLGHGGDWSAWVPDVRKIAEESRVLGWTSNDLVKRARRERSYVHEGVPVGTLVPIGPPTDRELERERSHMRKLTQIPDSGATVGWWKRLRTAVLGRSVVLLAALPLALVGCKSGPGIRVSVSLSPYPTLSVQVGGGELGMPQAPTKPEDPQPPAGPAEPEEGGPK